MDDEVLSATAVPVFVALFGGWSASSPDKNALHDGHAGGQHHKRGEERLIA